MNRRLEELIVREEAKAEEKDSYPPEMGFISNYGELNFFLPQDSLVLLGMAQDHLAPYSSSQYIIAEIQEEIIEILHGMSQEQRDDFCSKSKVGPLGQVNLEFLTLFLESLQSSEEKEKLSLWQRLFNHSALSAKDYFVLARGLSPVLHSPSALKIFLDLWGDYVISGKNNSTRMPLAKTIENLSELASYYPPRSLQQIHLFYDKASQELEEKIRRESDFSSENDKTRHGYFFKQKGKLLLAMTQMLTFPVKQMGSFDWIKVGAYPYLALSDADEISSLKKFHPWLFIDPNTSKLVLSSPSFQYVFTTALASENFSETERQLLQRIPELGSRAYAIKYRLEELKRICFRTPLTLLKPITPQEGSTITRIILTKHYNSKNNESGEPIPDEEKVMDCARQHIPGHLVVKRMGEGSFGIVYKAITEESYCRKIAQREPGAVFSFRAIKIPTLNQRGWEILKERREPLDEIVRNESQHTSFDLKHPNILTTFYQEDAEGKGYFMMDLYERTLAEKIAKEGPMPLEQALHYGRKICSALSHVHKQSLIYDDLHAGNIGLVGDMLFLADFGLAKILHRWQEGGGAKPYAGPRDTADPRKFDGIPGDYQSDVYSFGCLLYFMATGQYPFSPPEWNKNKQSEVEKFLDVARQNREKYNEILDSKTVLNSEELGPKLKSIIRKCWFPLQERYANATELYVQLSDLS